MKDKGLPIIDADFVVIEERSYPTTTKPLKFKNVRGKKRLEREMAKTGRVAPQRSPNTKGAEGRLDLLLGNALGMAFTSFFGPNPQALAGLSKAATMAVGKQRLRGPEWEILKGMLGG